MPWFKIIVTFLLTAGFAKLSTVILNRLLALPQPKWLIGATELVQILLIPVYPVILYCGFGNHQPLQFLESFEWHSIGPIGMTLVLIGAVGLALLIRSTINFQRYRPPQCQIANDSRIIDIRQMTSEQSWRETLVGYRPMRGVALLPGNEQFLLEVSTKTFTLPRIPQEWDGLSIVQLADTHFRGAVSRRYFEAVCDQAIALKPDLFVFTGDLLDDQALLDWLPDTLGRLKAPLGEYFILGNHDWYLDAPAIRHEFERHGWIDLSSRSQEITPLSGGPSLIIAGDETPWMGTHASLNAEFKERFHILLSHTPDNITWAREHSIDLVLAGHTHGGQIQLPIIGPVYSPSRYGCRFASGAFWLEPTLLYVSRGISGREPIRYRCLPELTKLVLKASSTSEISTE